MVVGAMRDCTIRERSSSVEPHPVSDGYVRIRLRRKEYTDYTIRERHGSLSIATSDLQAAIKPKMSDISYNRLAFPSRCKWFRRTFGVTCTP